MLRKIFLFLIISFLVFFGSLRFYKQKQLKIENEISKLKNIKSNMEVKQISFVSSGTLFNSGNDISGINLSEKEKLKKMVSKQLNNINLLSYNTGNLLESRYKKLYSSYIFKNNVYGAIKAIKGLLKYTNNKTIRYENLLDLYIKIGNFTEAENIAKQLMKTDSSKNVLLEYLYIKIQDTNFFDRNQVKILKALVSKFYKKGILSSDDLTFYNFLINLLSNWNISKLKITLNILIKDLKNPVYKNILYSFKNDLEVYKANRGAPLYYFKTLIALDLLKYGYFGVAKNIAESVYIQDSNYILPQQILAYTYFYMNDYKQALKYFHQLKDSNAGDKDEYNFFIGVSYYWLNHYKTALLYLLQVKSNFPYYLDILRYEFLIYRSLKNTDKIIDTIGTMMNYKLSYVDYYNIFKYLLFECRNCYKNNLKLLIKLIEKCYKDTDTSTQYVCWYGKANLFYEAGKKEYSIKYFKLLTRYFQDSYIYDILASYYESKKNIKKARYYYLKELFYTTDKDKREIIKEKIKKLFLKK